MAAAPVFLSHRSSLAHDTGSHPEQPARIAAIERELSGRDWLGFERMSSPEASVEALGAVHPREYIDAIAAFSAQGGGQIDADTVASAGSFVAALHAAGGAVAMVDLLLGGAAPYAYSSHRPPGHHALPARAMGFCLFNNVAVAARHALNNHGLERVMVLDWDVHHGNGTNDIFHGAREVLFISIHQSPLYPGTGAASDAGEGDGTGFTVNLPVPPGSGDGEFCSLVEGVAVPLARAYEPQLVLISAGYDAHISDPLADCRVTEAGYAAMTTTMRRVCSELEVPLGIALEGGYALEALARSVAATMASLVGPIDGGVADGTGADGGVAREARARLEPWWPALGS
jgi:acetoin utilization deacetylase AcuC-like enzyme